jgi:DnaJ like chaperone protein
MPRSSTLQEVRSRYRQLASENHPDRLIGRGLPVEAAAIAQRRMATINLAWERIRIERA